MKIGIVVPGGFDREPEWGRLEYVRWVVERVAARNEVHVFSIRGARRPATYPLHGATVHHAGAWPRKVRTFTSVLAAHAKGRFDLLHAFWVRPPGAIAVTAGALIRRPVLIHVTGGELVSVPDVSYGGLQTPGSRSAVRRALAGASRITVASRPNLAALEALGFSGERVPLGVDVRAWPPRPPRQRARGAPARLVHAANLSPFKDQPTLLEAAKRLATLGVDFQLDIAGRDMLGGAMQQLTARLGLATRVRFHGHLPRERLYDLMAQADLLWHTSRFEGGPLVVLEAAVLGVPTVGTAVGHVVDLSPTGAIAVPVGDPETLARETATLLDDESRRLALAREAQRQALASDADWTARRFEALYDEMLSGATQRGRGR